MRNHLSIEEQLLVNSEVEKRSKNIIVAYILCWLTGVIGGHRYYLGKTGTAIMMTGLCIVTFGVVSAIWAFIDLFLIPGIVNDNKREIEQQVTQEILARR
ncbi:TM2 domain-containing protein [Holzapfeliella sp. He02]|uniref:TM2 domain-containing protein n=1 Tax=Holzapfeliella saturejae TaxID=3082953 RepID=A0ABU8SHV9_9LACO